MWFLSPSCPKSNIGYNWENNQIKNKNLIIITKNVNTIVFCKNRYFHEIRFKFGSINDTQALLGSNPESDLSSCEPLVFLSSSAYKCRVYLWRLRNVLRF